jgi:hypothetical protein
MTTKTQQYKPGDHPIWDRKLTDADKKEIQRLMDANPVIDYLIAETIVLMPPARLKEICDDHRMNPKEPEPARVFTEEELKGGRILSDEEQKEIELEREIKDQERKDLYDKMQKEKEQ